MPETITETEAEQLRNQNAFADLFNHETGNLKPEPGSSPSVRQEVDLDIRVPRSAIVPDRKFFGSKHGDDQLMTNFVVPQLQLQKTIGVKMGTEPAAAEPGRTQNPGETVNAGQGTLAEPHISRAPKTFARPYRNRFKESSCRTTGEPQKKTVQPRRRVNQPKSSQSQTGRAEP